MNPNAHRAENRYVRDTYGLVADMPIFQAPDGFRLRAPWRECEEYTRMGWKHVPPTEDCPQCGGAGTYSSEVMARYGDLPHTCDRCAGTGKVRAEV
jgi:hypothetical protein